MTGSTPGHDARAAPGQRRPRRRRTTGLVVLFVAGAAIVASGVDMSQMLPAVAEQESTPRRAVWTLLLLYTLLLAVPFVPGAEIGLALLVVFGAVMAWPVYVATILALSIAFAAGRLASGSARPASEALAVFADGLRDRPWLQGLMRFRWLTVVALINMPGNTVIGGGGGIAMALGYSRAFSYPAFLACVAVAVAPVPALVLLAEFAGFRGLHDWAGSFGPGPNEVAGPTGNQ